MASVERAEPQYTPCLKCGKQTRSYTGLCAKHSNTALMHQKRKNARLARQAEYEARQRAAREALAAIEMDEFVTELLASW